MRRLLLFLAVLLLPFAAACQKTDETKPGTDSAILNTAFSRESVIELNIVRAYADLFTFSEQWAARFVEENYSGYAPAEIGARFSGGFGLNPGDLAQNAINVMTYGVTFRTEEKVPHLSKDQDGFYLITVQVVTETDESADTTRISGFAYGGGVIADAKELYAFLQDDPRIALKEYPVPELEGDARAVNINDMIPAEWGLLWSEITFLSDHSAVFLTKKDENCRLNFFDLTERRNFVDREDLYFSGTSSIYSFADSRGVTVVYNFAEGGAYYCSRYDFEGNILEEMAPHDYDAEEKFYLPDSGACILRKDGALWLLDEQTGQKTALLTGNESGDTDRVAFGFSGAVDGQRFLYTEYGWEWINECGVFDLSSMTKTPFEGVQFIIGYYEGQVYIFSEQEFDFEGNLYRFDANAPEAGGEIIFEGQTYRYAFSPDGRYFAYIQSSREGSDDRKETVCLIDLQTGETSQAFTCSYAVEISSLKFVESGVLAALCTRHAILDEYVYFFETGS